MQRPPSPGDFSHPAGGPLANPDAAAYVPAQGLSPGQVLAPPSAARGWPTLPELVNALKRRLVLATFLGLLVGVAAAAAVWLALPNGKHNVVALLEFTPGTTSGKSFAGEGEFDAFKQKQQVLIRGRMLLARVIANPAVAKLSVVRSEDDPVRFLAESIKTRPVASDLLEVTLRGDDAKQMQTILSTLITEYILDAKGADNRLLAERRESLERTRAELDAQIEARENAIRVLLRQKVGPSPEVTATYAKVTAEQLAEAIRSVGAKNRSIPGQKVALDAAQARLKAIDAAPVDPDVVKEILSKSPKYRTLTEAVDIAQDRLAQTLKRTTSPDAAFARQDQERVRQARQALADAAAADLPLVEQEARGVARKAAAAEADLLQKALASDERILEEDKKSVVVLQKQLDDLNQNGAKVVGEFEDLKPKKLLRNSVEQQLLELTTLDRSAPRVQKREDATIYLDQNFKQKLLLAVAALIAGTVAIMLAVAFLEWRSRRVDSVDQVVSELGLRVIGTIPAFPTKQALKSGDAANSQNWRFVLNESVNSARTMLLHTAKTRNMQVLMVTSAMQGEGKTSLASQLATSMATAGLRTLILDCDLRNPSMHKLFDAPLSPGCSEVLCQEVDVSDAVQPTAVPNLWLIPAGQCSNRVISALAQGHPLETLFNRLRGQFDFIVVDSCPVLPVADSLLVGQHVDGVLISILQDISQLPKVQQVSDRLTDLNIPLLGAVVNGIKPDIHAYGYNYVKQLPA